MNPAEAEYQQWLEHGGVFDLSARTKLRLAGADRTRYLNGQVTANVTKLGSSHGLPACLTTAKGRLCAVVQITALQETLLVDAAPELRESLAARLERYIVADDVEIEDATELSALFHFVGPAEGSQHIVSLAPSATVSRTERFGMPGWDLLMTLEEAANFFERLFAGEGPRMVSPELAHTIRLEAGLPEWGHELGEETLPPEAGLDRTHIDYAKGCYIGQEVISRIRSVGHVNRSLCTLVSNAGAELQAGWAIWSRTAPEKAVGELTSAGWSFALAKPIALGYLKRGAPETDLFAQPADHAMPPVEIALVETPLSVPFSSRP